MASWAHAGDVRHLLNRTHISGAARSCPGSSVCEPSCKLVTIEAMLSTLACVAFLVVQLVAHSGCDQTAFLVTPARLLVTLAGTTELPPPPAFFSCCHKSCARSAPARSAVDTAAQGAAQRREAPPQVAEWRAAHKARFRAANFAHTIARTRKPLRKAMRDCQFWCCTNLG